MNWLYPIIYLNLSWYLLKALKKFDIHEEGGITLI